MLLTANDGQVAQTPEQAEELTNAGYKNCYGKGCQFHISPEAQNRVLEQGHGYYTCPNRRCYESHDLMEDVPWHGADPEEGNFEFAKPYNAERAYGYEPGGGTRIGLNMEEQAEIGEKLVESLGSLPGYGPIVWWHGGGSGAHSPLDGATKEWGIEVKTIGYDAAHHRFIVGPDERSKKHAQAEEMKLRGVLGILVVLNYRASLADIYVKEMPLEHYRTGPTGPERFGMVNYRTNTGNHLIKEMPFKNPFMQPNSGAPHVNANDDLPF